MGNRVLKYLSVLALLSMFVLGVLVIAAHFLVTPQRIRDAIVPVLEQKLNRKVHLAAVDVSLFSGVTLSHLAIVDPENEDLLVAADKVVLRYQFWPLLLQRVVIDEIRVEHPTLNVERSADGAVSLALLNRASVAPQTQNATLFTSSTDAVDLFVSDLYVSQAEILFKDYSFGTTPHIYKFSEFDLRIGNLSFDGQSTVVLWGKFNGAPIDIEGSFSLGRQAFDLTLVTDGLDLIPLQPYYHQFIDGRLDGLIIDSKLRLRGGVAAPLRVSGQLTVRDLDVLLNAMNKYPLQKSRIGLTMDLGMDSDYRNLDVTTLEMTIGDLAAKARGRVTSLQKNPQVDLVLATADWSLRRLVQELPRSIGKDLAAYDPAGTMDGEWVVHGPISEGKALLKQGRLQLSAVQLSLDKWRPRIDGALEIVERRMDGRDLAISLGDNSLAVSLHCDDWQRRQPRLNLQVRSERFDLSPQANGSSVRLEQGGLPLAAQSTETGDEYRQIREPGPLQIPIGVDGTITINQLLWEQMTIEGLRGNFSLNNSLMRVDHLVGRLAEGTFRCDGQVDLSRQGFVYQGNAEMKDVDLATFVAEAVPDMSDSLTGKGRLNMTFKGAGTQSLRIQQNLSADGAFVVENGRMQGTALMKQLASLLTLPEFAVFSFDKGEGEFTLHTGGLLDYSSEFAGSRSRLLSQGKILLTKEISSTLDVYLAPDVVNSLSPGALVKKYMVDEEGWARVPLRVSGRYDRPQLTYNVDVLGRKVGDVLTKKLQEKLDENQNAETGDMLKTPAAELINSALKELLAPKEK